MLFRSLRLTSLPDLHYNTDVYADTFSKTSRQTLYLLWAIAIAIVLMAAINYTNFSTALSPMRIKSINTQKVFGASDVRIRFSLLFEAVLISLFSFLLALLFVYLFAKLPIARLMETDIELANYPMLTVGVAVLAIVIGIFAGLYPAFYITSFSPAIVLKGSFGLTPKGQRLRNILISIQFVASFALLIGTLCMHLQNHFMKHTPLGYDKEVILVANTTENIRKQLNAFTNQLTSYSGIEDVTYANIVLSSGDAYMSWGRPYRDKQINFTTIPIRANFLKVMGIELTEGRDFREDDSKTEAGVLIFNEKAKAEFGLELNEKLTAGEKIGRASCRERVYVLV